MSGWSRVLDVRLHKMLWRPHSWDREVFKNENIMAFNCTSWKAFWIKQNAAQHHILCSMKGSCKELQHQEVGLSWSKPLPHQARILLSPVPNVVLWPPPEHVHETKTQSGFFQRGTIPTIGHSCRRFKSPDLHSKPLAFVTLRELCNFLKPQLSHL